MELRVTEMSIESGSEWIESVKAGYEMDGACRLLIKACQLRDETKDRKELLKKLNEAMKEEAKTVMNDEEVEEATERIAKDAHKWLQKAERFQYKDGLLHRIDDIDRREGPKLLLCVPRTDAARLALFREAHDTLGGGHFGIQKTLATLRERFYWPRMKASVASYCNQCDTCHRIKAKNVASMGLLKPLSAPEGRWERIGMDFIVKLPVTASGNDAICTIIDHASKRVHFFTLKESTGAEELAHIFIHQYYRHHGVPKRIVSDRDQRFLSDFWKTSMSLMGTTLSPSTPFHPQTDGATEKANGIVGTFLKAYAVQYGDKWDEILPLAEFAYNSAHQSTLGMTPFFADLGYNPTIPLDTVVGVYQATHELHSARALKGEAFSERLREILSECRFRLQHAQDAQSVQANKNRRPTTIQKGDSVFLSTKNLPATYANVSDSSTKLRHRFVGPFEVERMVGDNAVRLKIPEGMNICKTQNVSLLKEDCTKGSRMTQGGAPEMPLKRIKGRGEAICEVEKIVDHAESGTNNKKLKYRVRFVGYDETEDEWKSLKELEDTAEEVVEDYHRGKGWEPPKWAEQEKESTKERKKGKAKIREEVEELEDIEGLRRSVRKKKKTKKAEEAEKEL